VEVYTEYFAFLRVILEPSCWHGLVRTWDATSISLARVVMSSARLLPLDMLRDMSQGKLEELITTARPMT
jgi:hypothetical protein